VLPVSRSRPASADEALRHRLSELGLGVSQAAGGATATEVEPDGGPPGSRPPRARLDPGRPGALVLCAVAVVSAALAAVVTWAGRPAIEPLPPAPAAVADSAAWSTGAEPPGPAPSSSSSQDEIVVAVVGQVVTPGLVTLPAGSRVADAVAAAGGALPGADLAAVNLARVLADGEQVAVGVPGAADGGPPAAGGADPAGQVNLNTATEAELEELTGVGPVLAGRIVQWRTDNGGFTSVDQLQDVDGIGPSTYEDLRDEVTV